MRSSPGGKPGLRFKVVLLGEPGVGKTSIFMRVKENSFGSRPTLGIENCSKDVFVNDTCVTFSLWDTAGQERFRTLTTGYFRNCQAVLLCYASDDPDSMNALEKWNADIEHYARAGVVKVVLGNKSDLDSVVTWRRLNDFCDIYQCQLSSQVSAKTGDGINELLEALARYLIRQVNASQSTGGPIGNQRGQGGRPSVQVHDRQDTHEVSLTKSPSAPKSDCHPC